MALKTISDNDKSKNKIKRRKYPAKHETFKKKLNLIHVKDTALSSINKSVDQIIPPAVIMSTFYPQHHPYSYPLAVNEWCPLIPGAPLFTIPALPILVNPGTIFSPQMCPYAPPVIIPSVIPSPVILSSGTSAYSSYESEIESVAESFDASVFESEKEIEYEEAKDPIEYYLCLPKDLFPSPRMLKMDPNSIIDEFCKLPGVDNHVAWILDMEFGVPKYPITRPIPSYNVKFGSIHCKNTPDAIHPGFESCSPDFKRVLLFYYDCIVSAWYRGYVAYNNDISVDNFQSWLMLPVQELGMCWPNALAGQLA